MMDATIEFLSAKSRCVDFIESKRNEIRSNMKDLQDLLNDLLRDNYVDNEARFVIERAFDNGYYYVKRSEEFVKLCDKYIDYVRGHDRSIMVQQVIKDWVNECYKEGIRCEEELRKFNKLPLPARYLRKFDQKLTDLKRKLEKFENIYYENFYRKLCNTVG